MKQGKGGKARIYSRSVKDNIASKFDSKRIQVRRRTKYSILLVKMLAKTALVSKYVSISGKSVKIMRPDKYLTDLLTGAVLRKFLVSI